MKGSGRRDLSTAKPCHAHIIGAAGLQRDAAEEVPAVHHGHGQGPRRRHDGDDLQDFKA